MYLSLAIGLLLFHLIRRSVLADSIRSFESDPFCRWIN